VHTIVVIAAYGAGVATRFGRLRPIMSPTWIWMQFAIVIFVLIGMVIAIVKLV